MPVTQMRLLLYVHPAIAAAFAFVFGVAVREIAKTRRARYVMQARNHIATEVRTLTGQAKGDVARTAAEALQAPWSADAGSGVEAPAGSYYRRTIVKTENGAAPEDSSSPRKNKKTKKGRKKQRRR